ncbi:MAG TPA: aldehyde dehydrogenase family protein [Chryseosolibacter sp.]
MNPTLSPQEIFANCERAVPALRREPASERKKRLNSLRRWIHDHRSDIHEAVFADLGKPPLETDATEIFHVLNEIKVAVRSLREWSEPKQMPTPFYMAGTQAWIQCEPKGVCLITATWNYPFSLAVGPMVSALAAGNSIILKPAEATPSVSALIKRMCSEIFDPSIATTCEGGVEVSQALLALPFNHIFFTGSTGVGKIVMKAAAEHLSSVTLELGGKSPAIICGSANINDAAERIAVGKFVNNGQTCIAPDYILVDEKIADDFVRTLISKTGKLFSAEGDFQTSPSYGRIVHTAHFARVRNLILDAVDAGATIGWQGPYDQRSRFMHPVILTHVPPGCRLMQEEIFGPVLPVISYHDLRDAIRIVNEKPKALALYVFTSSEKVRDQVLRETSSGTACINDCAIQFLHHNLPFGGINSSGIGKSHGHFGFLAFSNQKAVLKQKKGFTSVKLFYPPYTSRSRRIMDWFLRLF